MYQWLVGGFCATSGSAIAFALMRAKRYLNLDTDDMSREGFSPVRYEPMARLLSEEDVNFLKARPGVDPALVRRFRIQRRKVFRAYLCELASDFHRLHEEARVMLTVAPEEYADLVPTLMRAKVRFWTAMAGVEMRLTLHTFGVGQVDVRRLLAPLETLHSAIHRATPRMEPI
jgi:hypothetical protein